MGSSRASWIVVAALFAAAVGCSAVLGIDDWKATSSATSSVGTSGGAGGGSAGAGTTSANGGSGSGGGGGSGGTGGSGGRGGGSAAGGGGSGGEGGGTGGFAGAGGSDPCGPVDSCVPTVLGWDGPIAFQASGAGAPGCMSPYPIETMTPHEGAKGDDASCTPCGCDLVGTCSLLVETFGDASCSSAFGSIVFNSDVCVGQGNSSIQSAKVTAFAGPASANSCNTMGGSATTRPITYMQRASICATASLPGCGLGQVCAPPVPAGYSRCIHQTGDSVCPLAYPDKHLFFDSQIDTRGCAPCACGSKTVLCDDGEGELHDDLMCNGSPQAVVTSGGMCVPFQNPVFIEAVFPKLPQASGTCPPSGGQATGSVSDAAPRTICCE